MSHQRRTVRRLAILAREPRPGTVKTRLSPEYSPAESACLYAAFVRDTLDLAGRVGVPCSVFVSGGGLRSLRESAPGVTDWRGQGRGDLGARMRRAFAAAFRSGAGSVVMLGTDSPGLPGRLVRAAFRELRSAEVVVGPAADGGYYLIGLSRPCPALLTRMPWSRRISWPPSRSQRRTVRSPLPDRA